MTEFTFFWKNQSPFSQWHRAHFTIDGVSYSSAEQYMMHQKALLMNDTETANAIMSTDNSKEQKALGRQVKPFDAKLWREVSKEVVYNGNEAKFIQNDNLMKALLATVGTEIVEASPYDNIWGIGLGPDHPDRFDRSKWRGTNWLGQVLTKLRVDLVGK